MPPFLIGHSALPLVTTAVHAGHVVRPEVADRMILDERTRHREEDPYTDRVTAAGGIPIVATRSRFEVDLNRPREDAVYTDPDAAWGLDVWCEPLPPDVVERSLAIYDDFYGELTRLLDALAQQGPFLVLDVHSYNHRRDGAGSPPADPVENPEVNVGTGNLDRARWDHLVDRFIDDLGAQRAAGRPLDVRENVRFTGGHMSRWIADRYPERGCVLAVELKKTFMDEWTGTLDEAHLQEITDAIAAVVPLTLGELACGVP